MPHPSANDLPLAAEFPAATREQWRRLVADVLKGAPFESRLVAKTYDALAIEPLYERNAQAQPIAGRPPAAAAEAAAPAADAKPADQMGCMPGGGCCGAAACKQAAAAAASGTSANGEAPAPGGCPCGKAKKTQ